MWQTKLGRCIYTSPSGYKVYQNLVYRWLTLGSTALQTAINRRHPQNPVLYYLPALTLMVRNNPGPTCLLGLGGGAIPLMLEQVPLIAVDNSAEVIEIAKRYFLIDSLKNLTIVHDNAMDYVQNSQTCFAYLLVDLYNANHFPPECAHEAFFNLCKQRLTKHGLFAINLANIKEQYPLLLQIKKQFDQTLVIPIRKSTNMVIYAANNQSCDSFIEKIESTAALKRIVWVESWGYVGEYRPKRF